MLLIVYLIVNMYKVVVLLFMKVVNTFDNKINWVTPEPVVLQRNPEYICLI